MTAKQNVPTQ